MGNNFPLDKTYIFFKSLVQEQTMGNNFPLTKTLKSWLNHIVITIVLKQNTGKISLVYDSSQCMHLPDFFLHLTSKH